MESGNFPLNSFRDHLKLFLYEFLGTFILLVAINYSHGNVIIVCGGVFASCMITGRQTGTHLNFGVTIGVYIIEGKYNENYRAVVNYLLAGLAGGYAGSYYCYWALGPDYIKVFRPANLEWSIWYVMFIEMFFTWIFLTVVFHNKDSKLSIVNDMVVGVIASLIAIYFSCSCTSLITGAVMSPTVAIVNLTFVACVFRTTEYLKFLPAYIIGGALGGILAALFTRLSSSIPQFNEKHSLFWNQQYHLDYRLGDKSKS